MTTSSNAMKDETEKFIDYAKANEKKFIDWVAAWRNWMRKALEIWKRDNNEDDSWRL